MLHDIVLTLGLLSVARIEFSMTEIAALLTVIGYSMNEKVITFDRLKENLRNIAVTEIKFTFRRAWVEIRLANINYA